MPDRPPQAPEHDDWNKRTEKSKLPLFIILALICLVMAYVLSRTWR